MKMEKLEEFNLESQLVEDWLDTFETRANCLVITNVQKKILWCKSVIGNVGRRILKTLPNQATWDDVKAELKRFLGEQDSRDIAWKRLKQYQAEGKAPGEIASDVLNLAKEAVDDDDVSQKLAFEAFVEAIPWKFA